MEYAVDPVGVPRISTVADDLHALHPVADDGQLDDPGDGPLGDDRVVQRQLLPRRPRRPG